MAAPVPIPFYLDNMSISNFTIDVPQNVTNLLAILPSQAATQSGFLFTTIALCFMALIQYFALVDRSPFARFMYSDWRSISLSFAVTGSIGIWGIELGMFLSFQIVAIFVILFVLSAIYVKMYEDKE